MAGNPISGSLWTLWLYDVCEEIDLDALRAILGLQAPREPRVRHPSPEYVRFERPPVVQQIEAIVLEDGNRLQGELNYYEYGVVSIKLELPFQADWQQLADLSSRWMTTPEPEAQAVRTVRRYLDGAHAALIKPHENWLSEDYYIIHLKDNTKPALTAAELIASHRNEIARIVRGEQAELSREENRLETP